MLKLEDFWRAADAAQSGKIVIRKVGNKWAVILPLGGEPILADSFEIARGGVATFLHIVNKGIL